MIKKVLFIGVCIFAFASCSTVKPLYSWYNYEDITYFNGVENCMSEAEAKQEASRCLRCDHFGYGIFKGGRETLW